MKTAPIAALFFAAAFGGVFAYGWYKAPTEEQARAEAAVKDTIVAALGQPPGSNTAATPQFVSLKPANPNQAYRDLQAAYRKMNATCTAEARKAYGVAYFDFVKTVERAQDEGSLSGPDLYNERRVAMNQFMEATTRSIVVASDVPDREWQRMVLTLNRGGVRPLTRGETEFGGRYDDGEGHPLKPSPCEPPEG